MRHELVASLLEYGPSPTRHKNIIRRHRAEAPRIWAAIFRQALALAGDADKALLHNLRKQTE